MRSMRPLRGRLPHPGTVPVTRREATVNRRGVLGLVAGAVAGLLARRPGPAAATLRPPGALPPGAFERACIGCFRCAEVCPTRALRFPGGAGLHAGHPFLALRE